MFSPFAPLASLVTSLSARPRRRATASRSSDTGLGTWPSDLHSHMPAGSAVQHAIYRRSES